MKAVLIATDFLKDIDNSFKIIEINTNVHIVAKNLLKYFNMVEFDEFLIANNIDTIEFIYPKGLDNVYDLDEEREYHEYQLDTIYGVLGDHYSGSSITFNVHTTEKTAITIPQIEDGPNKLILRTSYDSTALIDDTYARDNWELLKLVHDGDPTSIPATYINHPTIGFDSIGTNIRDNGDFPNFIIKQRYPTTDYKTYPKVLKIDTVDKLNEIKNNLLSEEYLQEYIYNPTDTIEGKLKTYRSISMIYGPNLDTFNLIDPYVHTNATAPSQAVDYDENGFIQIWERPSFIQKVGTTNIKTTYHFDETSKIILADNTIASIDDITIGSNLKTLGIEGMPSDDENQFIWEEDYSVVINNTTGVTTSIEAINWIESSEWLMNVTLEGGIKFVDVVDSVVLSTKINDSGKVHFKQFKNINVGEYFIIYDLQTNTFLQKIVENIEYSYEKLKVYTVDVEPYDAFLTAEEDVETPRYVILQHNYGACYAWCCPNAKFNFSPCLNGGSEGYCPFTFYYEYCATSSPDFDCNICASGCADCSSGGQK
jgi:hypothetical protein